MARERKVYPYRLSLKEFGRWFAEARAGDGIIYHCGDLAFDRQLRDPRGEQTLKAQAISRFAAELYVLSTKGELHLLQRRIEPCLFEYIAIRTSPRLQALMKRWLRKPFSAHEMLDA